MDSAVIGNAIGALEKALSKMKVTLTDISEFRYGYSRGDEDDYDFAFRSMVSQLGELHDVLLVVLEAAQMPETRRMLVDAWVGFKAEKDGLSRVVAHNENEYCESPAFTFLERLVGGLRISVTQEVSSEEAWTLARLEAMLEDTAALVRRRGKPPLNEMELQKIMHDYLGACFPDFRKDIKIHGGIKNFEPDCGIASIGAAIEFKMAHTEEQVKVAFSGVVEDTAGYKGSKEWTRFYAVIYQAEPFVLKGRLQDDMKRIGAATWRAVLVNGATKRKKAPAKKAG